MLFVTVVYHIGQYQMAHVQETHQIRGNDLLIRFSLDIHPVAVIGDSRIVHQRVDLIAEALHSCGHQFLTFLIFAHIGLYHQGFHMIFLLNLRRQLMGFRLG